MSTSPSKTWRRLLDVVAELGEELGGRAGGRGAGRIDRDVDRRPGRPGDPQAAGVARRPRRGTAGSERAPTYGSPGAGPAVTSRSAALSRTRPGQGVLDGQPRHRVAGRAPTSRRPRVGLRPTSPQHDAGIRIEPGAVAAVRGRHHARGDRGRRSAGRAAGGPIERPTDCGSARRARARSSSGCRTRACSSCRRRSDRLAGSAGPSSRVGRRRRGRGGPASPWSGASRPASRRGP